MTGIFNRELYLSEMRKSMFDKLFFIDKIDADVIVDYGCADGTLLGMLNDLFPDKIYIGYDNDLKMVEQAKEKFPSIIFHSDWEDVKKSLNSLKFEKKALVLSSILHEIYSYCYVEEIREFNRRVFFSNFDYICIRDMHYSKDMISVIVTPNNVRNLYRNIPLEKIEEFEKNFGSIIHNKNFIHFLLKYRYDDNWEREVKENYFSYDIDTFLRDYVGDFGLYKMLYREHFCPTFVKQSILNDTKIDIGRNPTHIKLIIGKAHLK